MMGVEDCGRGEALAYPPLLGHLVVGRVDRGQLLIGQGHELLGQALCDQLVRVVVAHQLAPGGADLIVRHLPAHAEQGVGVGLVRAEIGLANAGVSLEGLDASFLLTPVPLGIALGLFVGKQIGVFGATWAAIRLRLAEPPAEASMAQLYGVALLCGIGFTMSLFIGGLAFAGLSGDYETRVKLGVLAGSLLSER